MLHIDGSVTDAETYKGSMIRNRPRTNGLRDRAPGATSTKHSRLQNLSSALRTVTARTPTCRHGRALVDSGPSGPHPGPDCPSSMNPPSDFVWRQRRAEIVRRQFLRTRRPSCACGATACVPDPQTSASCTTSAWRISRVCASRRTLLHASAPRMRPLGGEGGE